MENYFIKHQRKLLALANTISGKILLGLNQSDKVVKLSPNSCHLYKGGKDDKVLVQATFFTYPKVGKILIPILEKITISRTCTGNEAVAHFGYLRRSRKLPTIYLTTTTFFPSNDAAIPGPSSGTFSTAHDATTGTADSGASTFLYARLLGGNYQIERVFQSFDTSSITSAATVSAATSSIYLASKGGAVNNSYNVYNSGHSDTIVDGDFDLGGTTAYSNTAIDQTTFSTVAYNDFVFNSNGINGVSKTGLTKICYREVAHDVGNTAPVTDNNTFLNPYQSAQAGTTNDPKLVVTYAIVGGSIVVTFI